MISPERLRRFPHCAGAPDGLLKEVAMLADEVAFEDGQRLFEEGNPATHLMFLESGKVDIVYTLGDDRQVVVDTLNTGDTMAWSALLEPHVLTGSGIARGLGQAVRIEGQGLRRICTANPEFGLVMLTEVAKTLRDRLGSTRVQLAAIR